MAPRRSAAPTNEWAYEYTLENPDRLFFAALIPMQHPDYAVQEIRRVAALGCRVALVRPMDAMGNYPLQPKYEPVWDALEETGMIYGMHPFPAFGSSKPSGYSEQYSGAELIRKTITNAGLPHTFLTNVQNFQAEAALWVTIVLMSGFLEKHPKINAAVFEASSTWLSQRALNVRNLNSKTALTQEQVAYLDHAGSYEPKPRLKDMDIQGIVPGSVWARHGAAASPAQCASSPMPARASSTISDQHRMSP